MAETSEKKKKKKKITMAEKREADTKKPTLTTTKWPLIKPKQNLQITHLKDTDMFAVRNISSHILTCFSSSYFFICFEYLLSMRGLCLSQHMSLLYFSFSIVICVQTFQVKKGVVSCYWYQF